MASTLFAKTLSASAAAVAAFTMAGIAQAQTIPEEPAAQSTAGETAVQPEVQDAPQVSEDQTMIVPLPEDAHQQQLKGSANGIAGSLESSVNPNVTMTFSEDGNLNFNDGCNSGFTTYEFTEDGALQVGELATTRMACDEDTQADVDAFTSILTSNPHFYRVDGQTLMLGNPEGAIEFVAAQQADA